MKVFKVTGSVSYFDYILKIIKLTHNVILCVLFL